MSISCAVVLFSNTALPAVLELGEALNIRENNVSGGTVDMDRVSGILPKGTQIQIPDVYVVYGRGHKIDLGSTLEKWSSSKNDGTGFYRISGHMYRGNHHEFFFAVALPGISGHSINGLVPLQYLQRKGRLFIAKQNTKIFVRPSRRPAGDRLESKFCAICMKTAPSVTSNLRDLDEVAKTGVRAQAPLLSASSDPVRSSFYAKATGYFPSNSRMEGGFLDQKQHRLRTLQDFLAGKSDYVSVAMDINVFHYGTRLRIPTLEKKYNRQINFVVTDNGGAFNGQGASKIDICTLNRSAALSPDVNQTFKVEVLRGPLFTPAN